VGAGVLVPLQCNRLPIDLEQTPNLKIPGAGFEWMVCHQCVAFQRRASFPVEQADRDTVLTKRLGNGLRPVCRIVILGQVLDLTAPQVKGVVERGAGAHRLDKSKARVLDALDDQIGQVLGVPRKTPRRETHTRGKHPGHRVDGRVRRAVGCGLGLEAHGRSWRRLPLCQAIHGIVHDHVGDVRILPDGVGQVAAPDAEPVTISTDGNDSKIGIGDLDTGRHRQYAAMRRLEAIRLYEKGKPAGTANARHDHSIGRIEIKSGHGLV